MTNEKESTNVTETLRSTTYYKTYPKINGDWSTSPPVQQEESSKISKFQRNWLKYSVLYIMNSVFLLSLKLNNEGNENLWLTTSFFIESKWVKQRRNRTYWV